MKRLFTEIMIMGAKLMLWYCTLQRSMSCLPPWFLCNTRTGWLVALWPWCQTGGRGTASGGPGCTSEAPHNICAHPSSRGALLRKQTAVRVYIQKRSLYINTTTKVIRCNTNTLLYTCLATVWFSVVYYLFRTNMKDNPMINTKSRTKHGQS